MRIESSKEELLAGVNPAASVVETRQTLPILGHLHLSAEGDHLQIIGTDLEVELRATSPVTVAEEGQVTVPARKFLDIIRSLPESAPIQLSQEGERIQILSGRSRFHLAGLAPDDFPRLEIGDHQNEVSLPQEALKGLLERTSFAMARDDVRYYLNGILLEWTGTNLRAVATDGHRLALMDREVAEAPEEIHVILPRKGVQELERLLGDSEETIEVTFTPSHVRFQLPGITFATKLIEGRFPDYRRVIPEANGHQVVIDRATFQQALRRTAILANRKTHGIRVAVREGALELSAENPDQEEATEEVAADFSGDSIEIGFNVDYLQQAIGALPDDQVLLHLWDSQSSCLILPAAQTTPKYVIMPMRL